MASAHNGWRDKQNSKTVFSQQQQLPTDEASSHRSCQQQYRATAKTRVKVRRTGGKRLRHKRTHAHIKSLKKTSKRSGQQVNSELATQSAGLSNSRHASESLCANDGRRYSMQSSLCGLRQCKQKKNEKKKTFVKIKTKYNAQQPASPTTIKSG